MGVKKGLDLLELLLALCDLLCVFGRFSLLYEFIQLLELTEAFCTRMNCSSSPSARWLTSYAFVVDVSADVFDALCVRWDVTVRSHCQCWLDTVVAAFF